MSHSLFFIGGIHGVGKTTSCVELSKNINVPTYTASKIIDKIIVDKKVMHNEVQDNQELLILGLSSLVKSTDIILDGHFVLLGNDNNTIKIPIDTFQAINPKVMFVITDTPKEIYKRLLERDKTYYSLEVLEKLQTAEISYAHVVSNILDIPLYVVERNEKKIIIDIIKKYRKK